MDLEKYEKLVNTFFKWDQPAILTIFEELLSAASVADSQPGAPVMSQNYETARENPEINMLPGNLKDARDSIFPFFWGTESWNSPLHLENVRGPANHASLVGALACLLKNPNLCTDRYSQRSNELELKAVTSLANLTFYHTQDPWGVFTIGGTISNFYGAKIGLERVLPGTMQNGLCVNAPGVYGICSAAGHYSNQTIAGWIGIGTKNLIKIPTDEHLAMRLDLFEAQLESTYQSGGLVAYVTATFGSTDGFGVDDVAAIREIIDRISRKYSKPTPQLHVDAAVGWALTFLTDYNIQINDLKMSEKLLEIVRKVQQYCKSLQFADSITIDFHKMGRGHYPSSAFIVNRREDLKYLARSVSDTPYFAEATANRDPALFTLECSRPAIGPYTVMASLDGIGLNGWRMLVARSLELAQSLKDRLNQLDYCRVLNNENVGPVVNWWVLPKGRNANDIFERLVLGKLTETDQQRYFKEVRRMYDKREMTADPARDAKLGFTTDFGFNPHGVCIPAWKAVFFNPQTDDAIIDRIIYSLEDLV